MHTFNQDVFNINAGQYQTGPIHESDNHIFAKFGGGGGGGGPPDPPLDLRMICRKGLNNSNLKMKIVFPERGKTELYLSIFKYTVNANIEFRYILCNLYSENTQGTLLKWSL